MNLQANSAPRWRSHDCLALVLSELTGGGVAGSDDTIVLHNLCDNTESVEECHTASVFRQQLD